MTCQRREQGCQFDEFFFLKFQADRISNEEIDRAMVRWFPRNTSMVKSCAMMEA